MGNITMWSDAYIQSLNPALLLPAIPVVRVVRTDVIPINAAIDQLLDDVPIWRDTIVTSQASQYIVYPPGGNGRSSLAQCIPRHTHIYIRVCICVSLFDL